MAATDKMFRSWLWTRRRSPTGLESAFLRHLPAVSDRRTDSHGRFVSGSGLLSGSRSKGNAIPSGEALFSNRLSSPANDLADSPLSVAERSAPNAQAGAQREFRDTRLSQHVLRHSWRNFGTSDTTWDSNRSTWFEGRDRQHRLDLPGGWRMYSNSEVGRATDDLQITIKTAQASLHGRWVPEHLGPDVGIQPDRVSRRPWPVFTVGFLRTPPGRHPGVGRSTVFRLPGGPEGAARCVIRGRSGMARVPGSRRRCRAGSSGPPFGSRQG